MSRERTDYERLVDTALLLSLWSKAQTESQYHTVGGRTKAIKLAFAAAYPLYKDKVKAFNFEFYKWHHGPMANNLTGTVDYLRACDLAYEDEEIIITEQGLSLGKAFAEEVLALPNNRPILYEIDRSAREYGRSSLSAVLDAIYGMKVSTVQRPTQRRSIGSLNQGETIVENIEEEDASQVIEIPEEWEITLHIALHPKALRGLRQAIDDTYDGRTYTADDFWSAVQSDLHPSVS